MNTIIIIVILKLVFNLAQGVNVPKERIRKGMEMSMNGRANSQSDGMPTSDFGFLRQPLDHFDPLNSRFWDQRYYWNSTNYRKGGPIFLLVGNEGSIDGFWERQGTVGAFCAELNGFAFVLEHRFFGKSWPIRNTKTESLKYLTMELALADLAHFVIEIKHKYDLERNKIIVIGRSYSGELAIYFREKYPHLADIVWATSAPILYKYDFSEYMEFIGEVIRGVSQKCYDVIKEGFSTLVLLTSQPGNSPEIQKTFKLCSKFDNPSRDDVGNLFRQLVSPFTRIVQYNGQLDNHSVEHTCSSIFENERDGLTPIQKIAQFNDIMNDLNGIPCIDFLESTFCSLFNGTGIGPINSTFVSSASKNWFWMVCTQVGSLQTLIGRKQPFGQTFPASHYVKRCQCAFDDKITEDFIRQRVRKNLHQVFGGTRLAQKITRVIFVNGRKDPWSPLGILFQNQTSAENKVIYIPDGSHSMDMISPSPQDSSHLIFARQQIKRQIKEWMRMSG